MFQIRENILVILLFLLFRIPVKMLRCWPDERQTTILDYHIMQMCTLSEESVIKRVTARNLAECKTWSNIMKGLAFNFADLENVEWPKENCIIYECPELNITALKQNESVFHYYSAYAKIWPLGIITCIPREGLYMLTKEKLNYTEAIDECEEHGGTLMNIMSEDATQRAANVLGKSKISSSPSRLQAYVGLDDIEQEGKFQNLCGKLLNRSPWRAWAPGEPRNKYDNEDCVTIDSSRYWRVHPCDKKMSFICEIPPGGPFNLTEAYCTVIENAGKLHKMLLSLVQVE